jgi:CRISPR-associated endonuclease/helicase Cas3
MSGFDDFFQRVSGHARYEWQARLAQDSVCRNRLIRIPTGFGKTAGVTIAWLWNRLHERNDEWPRRLVMCLPMRTLVEQTERAVKDWVERAEHERSAERPCFARRIVGPLTGTSRRSRTLS